MAILIYTPTYADLLRPETVASIEAQATDVETVHIISDEQPYAGRDTRNVIAHYQQAWRLALDGDYDALLTVEHDMVLPANAVQRLYETDAPVVYGVYMLRHGTKTLSAWQHTGGRNLGMSLSLYPAELKRYRQRGWGEVCGVGWGCTLIRRPVLERITVRQTGDGDAGDIAFATDCVRAGIRQIARFDVPCGHIEPDGNVLDPYRQGGIVRRVLALQNVTVNADGQTVAMKHGRYYSLPPDVAMELQRAGYVIVTNDDEARETADLPQAEETAVARVTKRKPKRGAD